MSVTKEQWEKIEQQLQGIYGEVVLSFEGRKLTIEKRLIKENKLAILVFIDGTIKPANGFPGGEHFDEFVKSVWRERTHSVWSPTQRAKIIKTFGKRRAKKQFPDLEKKLSFWTPDFSTAASLRRKLQKLDGLEVVSIGYQPVAAEV